MPAALKKVSKKEVRAASEGGLSDAEISKEFGVDRALIRQWRKRDGDKKDPWLTPKQLREKAELLRAEKEVKARLKFAPSSGELTTIEEVRQEHVTGVTPQVVTAESSIADKLLKNGELGSITGSEILLDLLIQARERQKLDPNSILPLIDAKGIVQAIGGVRKASGMDRINTAVQLNFGAGWKQPRSLEDVGEVIDV